MKSRLFEWPCRLAVGGSRIKMNLFSKRSVSLRTLSSYCDTLKLEIFRTSMLVFDG